MYFTLLAVLDCIYGAKLLQVFLKLFSLQIHTSTQAPIRLRLNGRKLTENKPGRLQLGQRSQSWAAAVVGNGLNCGHWQLWASGGQRAHLCVTIAIVSSCGQQLQVGEGSRIIGVSKKT